jgi:hypothetical protein
MKFFDTSIDLEWQRNGRYKLCSFKYGEFQYTIQIENKPIHITELKGKNTAEISFFRTDLSDEATHSTTGDIDLPFKIYGVVANALAEKYHEYDAFFFSAISRHSSSKKELDTKAKIYFFLADKLSKKVGGKVYDNKDQHGLEFIVSKIKFESNEFIDEQLLTMNMIDDSTIPDIKTR